MQLSLRALITLCLSLFSIHSFSQTPSIRIDHVPQEPYCIGSELIMDATVGGVYPADNQFQVVAYFDNQERVYPAILVEDQIITRITDPIFANAYLVSLKLRTSNPKNEIAINHYIEAHGATTLTLMSRQGYDADTLNASDPFRLKIHCSNRTEATVILNSGDSLRFSYTNNNNNSYPWIDLPRPYDHTYAIKEVKSKCNTTIARGEVKVKVNEWEIKPVNVWPREVCGGGEMFVEFSTLNGKPTKDTPFKIRLAQDSEQVGTFKYVDIPATLIAENKLVAKIPTHLITEDSGSLYRYVGIVTDNPTNIAFNKDLYVRVHQTPGFTLTASDFYLGGTVELSTNPRGMPPFKVTLESGEVMSYRAKLEQQQHTKVYKVTRFESGCGVIDNPAHIPLGVTALPSLYIPPMDTAICAGQRVKLPIQMVGTHEQTTFQAVFKSGSISEYAIQADVEDGFVEFEIPKGLINTANNIDYLARLSIQSQLPHLVSNYINLNVVDIPTVTVYEQSSNVTLATPGVATIQYLLRGSGNYVIEYEDGTIAKTSESHISKNIFTTQSTTFGMKQIHNQCFTNSQLPKTPILVSNPASSGPAMFIEVVNEKRYCLTDSIELNVQLYGDYQADNTFKLSYWLNANDSPEYPLLEITKSGLYKVKPEVNYEGDYQLNFTLRSTSPEHVVNAKRISIHTPPKHVSFITSSTQQRPILTYENEISTIFLYRSTATEIEYQENGVFKKLTYRDTDPERNAHIRVPHRRGETTAYTLISASNACGNIVATPPVTTHFKGALYEIVLNNHPSICAGQEAEFNFSIDRGTAVPGTTYTLEMAPYTNLSQLTEIQTISNGNKFQFTLPALPVGHYNFKVKSSEGVYSNTIQVFVNTIPKVLLTTPNSQNILAIPYGNDVPLIVKNAGGEIAGIQYSDTTIQRYSNTNQYMPHVYQEKKFTIEKVWNECGYGTTDGFVDVKLLPIVEMQSILASNHDATICPGKEIEVSYTLRAATLSKSDTVKFSLYSAAMKKTLLASTTEPSGRIKLTIPATIYGTEFEIIAEIPTLKISNKLHYTLFTKPDLHLFGDHHITAGERASVYVKINKPFTINQPFYPSDGSQYRSEKNTAGEIIELKLQNIPKQTTTYTLLPPKDVCGNGDVSGSATISVDPRLAQRVLMTSVSGYRNSSICNGDEILIQFEELGLQNSANEYTVILTDSTGHIYTLPTEGTSSPIKATIPKDFKESAFNRIRIQPKDPLISGSSAAGSYIFYEYPTAKVVTPIVERIANELVEVELQLTGSKPVTYTYFYFDLNSDHYNSYETWLMEEITKFPIPIHTTSFDLYAVKNRCGYGDVIGAPRIDIALITGVEEVNSPTVVSYGPNPTHDAINFVFADNQPRSIEVISNDNGRILSNEKSSSSTFTLALSTYPSGVYLVRIQQSGQSNVYKIIKQ